MGGIGSGSYSRYKSKDTTGDFRAIDVRRWHRDGLLKAGRAFGWQWTVNDEVSGSIQVRAEPGQIILTYRHRERGRDWKDESYPVQLDWSACNLGGERPWFLCPARGCGRRVAILYCSGIFACRHCHQLAYPSQREAADDRAARRTNKLRDRLDWEQGLFNGYSGLKPKGMHWRTFVALTAQHDNFMAASLAGITLRLKAIGDEALLKEFIGS